ncbi:EamA family transporter [Helicobacter saguini]|uniref:DMT family transporter n=1 Tax=Helicobacter saguini TaxID=1548018 RepID=A0A347VRZ1_9HELI|nr:DMT family transporter [Helicobacter saguini]MWV62720.1 EamA family transporter [Helicobacter saguini]MWV66609.1 EamA family transporter [Helicobacter saguini]MWV68960.1 EamA family transporter [Helicobacter saguini]MWV71487.1 EamA family transporter [Helicobacter saguini]TLD94129.1 DMT family transporter [Helicobacter saguini]
MNFLGHFYAFLSVFIWSSLYISTKILLESFDPLELLFLQFIIGYITLFIMYPKFNISKNDIKNPLKFLQKEKNYILAALFGICFYNLFLNLSMIHTNASNVSVIIATAPLFSALISFIFGIEKPQIYFFLGFFLCIFGIFLLSFNGDFRIYFNIKGDILAFLSAFSWGVYAVIISKINSQNLILSTRKIIFYGILFILPALFFITFDTKILDSKTLAHLLFLGIFSSGICFILWNKATQLIGVIHTNIYVYLTPIITIFAAFIFLDEPLTLYIILGSLITIFGVLLSEHRLTP